MLNHRESVVRQAAFAALTSMGAPDPGFDAVASESDRAEAMAKLRDWAEAND